MAKKDKAAKGAVVTIDWKAYHKREKKREKEGGGGQWLKRVKEGDYPFKIKTVKIDESKAGNKMFVVTFIGTAGKVKNKQTRDYFTFTAEALFKLVQLLEAVGEDIPEDTSRLNGADLIGKEVGITLHDEEYEGKIQSKPDSYLAVDDIASDSEDDADDSDDAPDFSEMDMKALKKYVKKNKLKIKGLETMKLKKAQKAVAEAADADEDLEAVDLDEM